MQKVTLDTHEDAVKKTNEDPDFEYYLVDNDHVPVQQFYIPIEDYENIPEVNYYYPRQEFKLTINYVINDESADAPDAPDPYEGNIAWGVKYGIASPTLEGYVADITVAEGTMPTEDREVTVTYTKYVPPTPPEPTPESEDINAQTGDSSLGLVGILVAIVAIAGVGLFANRRRYDVRGKHSIR